MDKEIGIEMRGQVLELIKDLGYRTLIKDEQKNGI